MTDVMRALRWHGRKDVRLDRVPMPVPGPDEVLVRVEMVGLCGTDLEEYESGPLDIGDAPVTLGHEVVGTVVASPGGHHDVGTRVIPDVVRACGTCWWCVRHEVGLCERLVVLGLQADGGLADFMVAPAASSVVVSAAVPPEAAVFAEPLSVAVRALRKVPSSSLAGATVLVVGLGTIGLLTVQVAAAWGAGSVVGVDPVAARRRLAVELGASDVLGPDDVADAGGRIGDGRGADVVVECVGAPAAVAQAVLAGRRGATIVLVGTGVADMPIPVREVVLQEKRLIGSAAHVWDEDVAAAVALLERGLARTDVLVRSVVPLDTAVEEGFRASAPVGAGLKTLVRV